MTRLVPMQVQGYHQPCASSRSLVQALATQAALLRRILVTVPALLCGLGQVLVICTPSAQASLLLANIGICILLRLQLLAGILSREARFSL